MRHLPFGAVMPRALWRSRREYRAALALVLSSPGAWPQTANISYGSLDLTSRPSRRAVFPARSQADSWARGTSGRRSQKGSLQWSGHFEAKEAVCRISVVRTTFINRISDWSFPIFLFSARLGKLPASRHRILLAHRVAAEIPLDPAVQVFLSC